MVARSRQASLESLSDSLMRQAGNGTKGVNFVEPKGTCDLAFLLPLTVHSSWYDECTFRAEEVLYEYRCCSLCS